MDEGLLLLLGEREFAKLGDFSVQVVRIEDKRAVIKVVPVETNARPTVPNSNVHEGPWRRRTDPTDPLNR